MNAVAIISKKRDGGTLSRQELDWFVRGCTRGDLPDCQAAAWLMAVYLRGMSYDETVDLTRALARSGRTLDLGDIRPAVVDKHSTGGVGDKTTLVVAPLVAASGLPFGKMSGRGLGFSGGTLDKLESIRGFRTELSAEEFTALLRKHGIVLAGQSRDLAPADGKLYALRNLTGTVASIPLIAASIMSKKIAAGASAIVLDVKVGRGAFMRTESEARALAETMVRIGTAAGLEVGALLSDMEQPLGNAVGNALEVSEAIDTLRGDGPPDLVEHCLAIGSELLMLAGCAAGPNEARRKLQSVLDGGHALEKFREWVAIQGGDPSVVDSPDGLPRAGLIKTLASPRGGYVAAVDAMKIGSAAVRLRAGRERKGDVVDPAAGIVLAVKVGMEVVEGAPLLTLHANDGGAIDAAERLAADAFAWQDEPVAPPRLFRGRIGPRHGSR